MSTYDTSVIRDQNRIPIWWGLSSTDGVTLTPIKVDSVTGYPVMEFGATVMPVMSNLPNALPRDGNRIPCLAGVSNSDSAQFIPISVNPSTGAIQAQTT